MATGALFVFCFALFAFCSSANKVEDQDQCRVYAGGQVYPERTKISEHAVHWSKAQSSKFPYKVCIKQVMSNSHKINSPRKEGGLGNLKYPLLSDINHQVSKDYGVLLENEGHTLSYQECTLKLVGRSVDETLRLVQAFQYTDKHGEVCPAGWKPGKDTIIPDPTQKKKYFEKQAQKQDL
ncbi:predicted protein [Nematostella vectensis]|uniref:thioredoxin-dependent peroxiredoxin n=1 Tax=Nematostella vectensis TaxID=45351 RepID=A7T568_NEMVE|nr:predicted protein [Nematostella vectensis]|eukprot:XP_001620995.1 hypothetical protein NEMVEDRAFT_v1g222475 [Nematostella vectensis]